MSLQFKNLLDFFGLGDDGVEEHLDVQFAVGVFCVFANHEDAARGILAIEDFAVGGSVFAWGHEVEDEVVGDFLAGGVEHDLAVVEDGDCVDQAVEVADLVRGDHDNAVLVGGGGHHATEDAL